MKIPESAYICFLKAGMGISKHSEKWFLEDGWQASRSVVFVLRKDLEALSKDSGMVSYTLSAVGSSDASKKLKTQFHGQIRFNMGGYKDLEKLWLMDDVIAWGYGHLKFTGIRTARIFIPK